MEEEFEPVYSWQCIYNTNVICEDKHCYNCGWNPAVEEERKKKAREKCTES